MQAARAIVTAAAGAAGPSTTFASQLPSNITNTTSLLSSYSVKDFALLPLRAVVKIDHVLFDAIPTFVIRTTRLDRAAGILADLWARNPGAAGGNMVDTAGQVAAGAVDADSSWRSLLADAFQQSTLKSYASMLQYVLSRWAVTCFVMALILNRVGVYAASRQRVNLTWSRRLLLRLGPIILFLIQIRWLLQAIRCQTSPDFALFRHGDMDKYNILDWSREGGALHQITSTFLWWGDDRGACRALGFMRSDQGIRARLGSFSLLWPTFLRLCLSHFVESIGCSLEQRQPMTEVGMSVFEHSLAFAEAETMIIHALGVSVLGATKVAASTSAVTSPTVIPVSPVATTPASAALLAITDSLASFAGPHVLDRVNVPVEVLLVALLSCCNAFTSHIISVLGQQKRLRLVNTTVWGLAFMAALVHGFFSTSEIVQSEDGAGFRPVRGLMHFPFVAIIGFVPHMLIFVGIISCITIYLIALLMTAISLGTNGSIRQPSSLAERIGIAHDNLQAAVHLKSVKIRWSDDFYTALLRVGFTALTAASEAVFMNEGRSVEMRQFTWLEEERLDDLDASKSALAHDGDGQFQIAEEFGLPPSVPGANDRGGVWQSGYSRERKFDPKIKGGQLQQADGSYVYPNPRNDGVGALQRTTRFYLLFIFLRGVFFTVGGWLAFGMNTLLDRVGITARPRWLQRVVGRSLKKLAEQDKKTREDAGAKMIDFWLTTDDGKPVLPQNDDFDIEPEMRKRMLRDDPDGDEEMLDEKLYNWWKSGGWFGNKDFSGDFAVQPGNDVEDVTSVISFSTAASNYEDERVVGEDGSEWTWESESGSEGRHTPTQAKARETWSFSNVLRHRSASPVSTFDTPLDPATLARLLDPPDAASREEARMLASHFATTTGSNARVMTRSQYRQQVNAERSRVLLAGRVPVPMAGGLLHPSTTVSSSSTQPLTPTEESRVLEQLILTRRKQRTARPPTISPSAASEVVDDEHSAAGPPCVVCQSTPRTIIAWPCRCLCVCEDCRLSLATNNFANCVTCRRNVGGFVRLYVP